MYILYESAPLKTDERRAAFGQAWATLHGVSFIYAFVAEISDRELLLPESALTQQYKQVHFLAARPVV